MYDHQPTVQTYYRLSHKKLTIKYIANNEYPLALITTANLNACFFKEDSYAIDNKSLIWFTKSLQGTFQLSSKVCQEFSERVIAETKVVAEKATCHTSIHKWLSYFEWWAFTLKWPSQCWSSALLTFFLETKQLH